MSTVRRDSLRVTANVEACNDVPSADHGGCKRKLWLGYSFLAAKHIIICKNCNLFFRLRVFAYIYVLYGATLFDAM